jgi:integrase
MGAVYREQYTKPLPAGASISTRKGVKVARWKDAKGRQRTETVKTIKGIDRIVCMAATYTAKYKDAAGVVRRIATGCRDEMAARSILGDLERRAVRVKSGILTSDEDAVALHQAKPLATHFADYLDHQRAKEVHPRRVADTESQLKRIAAECNFIAPTDLDALKLERWLTTQFGNMSAATRNEYRAAIVGFCNWAVRNRRMLANPLANVPIANVKLNPQRKRRALTEQELTRLIHVARQRPLIEKMTIRRGANKGKLLANVQERVRTELECLGWERALIYKTLVLTGLRKGELASLTAEQLHLDGPHPYAVLDAADEKNRQGNSIPIRSDLAADLRHWLAHKLTRLKEQARGGEGAILRMAGVPSRLSADTPVFKVPAGLVRILNRDLKLAGIPKRDERGRTIDVHALRHSFGTLLSKCGVAPRIAQAAMRHSKIDLTMNVYTDPKLLDVHGALNALPPLPLSAGPLGERNEVRATGTDRFGPSPLVPPLGPTTDKAGHAVSNAARMPGRRENEPEPRGSVVSGSPVKAKEPPTTGVNGSWEVGGTELESVTSTMSSSRISHWLGAVSRFAPTGCDRNATGFHSQVFAPHSLKKAVVPTVKRVVRVASNDSYAT